MSKIGLIIGREFNQRVRKRSFIITTLLTPLLMVGMMVTPALMMSVKSGDTKEILVVDNSGFIAQELQSSNEVKLTPTDQTPEQLRENQQNIYGFLVIGEDIVTNPQNVQLYSYDASTMETQRVITSQISKIIENKKLLDYDIDNLQEILSQIKTNVAMQSFIIGEGADSDKESSSVTSMVAAYIFGFMIYMFIFIYGGMVMHGVIEEKNSKVLEIIVSSVKPFELMMGKILGVASVAITQFLIWVALIFLLGSVAMQFLVGDAAAQAAAMAGGGMAGAMPAGMDPESIAAIRTITDISFITRMIGGFLIYFVGGYLLYAAMFAAIGSAVDNAQDAQQLQTPITIPLILAILVTTSVMQDPNSNIAFWFSIIPLTSPIVMIARLSYGVPFWEVALSVTLLYASFVGMVWTAGKIYRVGIFMYGKKPSFKELYKWINYK